MKIKQIGILLVYLVLAAVGIISAIDGNEEHFYASLATLVFVAFITYEN